MNRLLSALTVSASLAMLLVTGSAPAQRRGGGLRAQIYVVQAAIPRGNNERALLAFARGHNARRLTETTDVPIPERKWLGSLIVAFTAAPDDLEYHVIFYDVTGGDHRFIDDMTTLINDRSQRTYVQRLRLDRPKFRPNRRIEMVVTVKREEVGRATFDTVGDEEQRSGRVDFSDDDTRRREE